jgi:cobalt-zinc-cadmium efflux system protein
MSTGHGEASHTHGHSQGHHIRPGGKLRPLAIALLITTLFLIIEVIGALITNSLALLADAGHMLTDVAALALSLLAVWIARQPATPQRSYGYQRAEVLAATANAATLIAVSLFIFWEAFQRLDDPPEIDSVPMLAVAAAGLLANAASAWVLMRGGGHEESLNVRGALLHVIGDMFGSVGAIGAALIMVATGWYLADPLLSAGIGALILWSSFRLLRESLDVLLESTPRHINPAAVRSSMESIPGVEGVHDLHVWTVTSGFIALSAHVEIPEMEGWNDMLIEISTRLRERFGIVHVTLQPERASDLPEAFRGCSLDSPEGRAACMVRDHEHD